MIKSEKLIYYIDQLPFEGVISWDDEWLDPKPGIMIAPTFRGQTDFEVQKSRALAKLGYISFAIDLYGQGRRASTSEEANALMGELNSNRQLLKERITKTLTEFRKHPRVDIAHIGAIGFCFGGKCVLDLARSGADVKGVVSFHGIYDSPSIQYSSDIHASILVLHGWDDPLARPQALTALAGEMTNRNADWQIIAFGHTGHAFTNPNVHDREGGMFYQEKSNRRAWLAMENFFKELFVKKETPSH